MGVESGGAAVSKATQRTASGLAGDAEAPLVRDPRRSPSRLKRPGGARRAALTKEEKTRLRQLDAVRKMNKGWFDDLSVADINDLFVGLDQDHNGFLDFSEIESLLKEVLDPPCTDREVKMLWEFTDQNADQSIEAEELHAALFSGPIKAHIRQAQMDAKLKRDYATAAGINVNVDRDLLHYMIAEQVESDDAFATLPYSIAFFIIFAMLVTYHLNIEGRRWASVSMETWIGGWGDGYPGPYLKDHVANAGGFFWWLDLSGLPGVVGDCDDFTRGGVTSKNCHLANRNILLGDARMSQKFYGEAAQPHVWLLSSPTSQAYLQQVPGDYLTAARAAAMNLKNAGWGGFNVEEIHLEFSTYNPATKLFVTTDIKVELDKYGGVAPIVSSQAVGIDPYADPGLFLLDAIYLVMVLYLVVHELHDIFVAIRVNGYREACYDYWGFWNIMDWFGVFMATYCILIWFQIVTAMQADSILTIAEAADQTTVAHIMDRDTLFLDTLSADLVTIKQLFFQMQLLMGLNCLTCVLRFFKAFKANPRLEVVTKTLTSAAVDIGHFAIVMITVFTVFAVLGHVWFGEDIIAFSTFERSLNTCFTTLMGEHEWYRKVTFGDVGMGSGMPEQVVTLWLWVYLTMVLLILLNMLMAMVLDHYGQLVSEMGSHTDTVWGQTRQYLKRKREFKGWLPLAHMLLKLEYDENPAHAEQKVTEKSLMKAFEGVTREQATWLMEWLQAEATSRSTLGDSDMQIAMLKQIEQAMEASGDSQKVFSLQTALGQQGAAQARLPPWSLIRGDGTGGPYEVLHDAMEPIKLQQQEQALVAISKVLGDLTTRLDSMVYRTQPMHEFVAELSHTIESVSEIVDELPELPALPAPLVSVARPARLLPLPAPPPGPGQEAAPPRGGKEVAGCIALSGC
mmetsp:Transcript_27166/g.71741  ORF Transcript_27166/g.71741 Transcript_27166/m.71741 type:complete len:908 (+) Transcript_27166:80-2803(+)